MRDHTMFDFLVEDAPTKSVDLELAKEFAKQAAVAFLGTTHQPLNEAITKIAEVEKLSPDQVYLVCQEANKLVNTELFKTAEDKYTKFPLADASEILNGLECGQVKTASANHGHIDKDYALEPGEEKAYHNDFTLTKTAGHAGLADNSKREQRIKMEKTAAAKQRLEDDYLGYRTELENLEVNFVKTARNQLLPLSLDARRETFPYITYICKEAGLNDDRTQQLMGYLDRVMVKQGLLEKTADIKADPSLISDKLNAKVINGQHPLYIAVKTIKEKDDEKKLYEDRRNVIQEQMADYNADGAVLGHKKIKEL